MKRTLERELKVFEITQVKARLGYQRDSLSDPESDVV